MSGKKIGLVLALDGEKEFKSAIRSVKEEVKMYQSSIKDLDKAFEGNRNSMEALTKKQEALAKKQEAYKKQLDAAKSGLDNAKRQYQDQSDALEKLKNKLNDAERELKQMADAGDTTSDAYKKQKQEVDSLREAVGKQTANLNDAQARVNSWTREVNSADSALNKCDSELRQNSQYLDEAARSADGCATSIDRYGNEATEASQDTQKFTVSLKDMVKNKLVDLGGDILRDLGQKAIEAAKYVVEVGSNFEAAMSKVQALSGASGSQLESLSNKARELGSSTRYSATEVAEAFGYMSLAGWDTTSMLEGIDGVLNLAASSEMDLAQASDMVTDYLSAFGLEASDTAHMVDMLAYAQANSNTTTQQLGEAWGNCAANMNAAGQDMETTTAILQGFANQGLKGSEAGTKLAAIMRDITAKMEDGAIQIGNTTIAVQDSNGNFRDMTDILADVEKATDGMGTAEKAAALQTTFTSRSVSGLNMILNEGVGNIASYEEQLRSSDGAAASMASTMQENLQGKITAFNSAVEGLGIQVFNYISGPAQGIVEAATGAISAITAAITPQKTELESFIEDIEKSNQNVQTSIEHAKSTVSNAELEVGKLESAKTFLQGVLDNCSKFNETDLSAAGVKIQKDIEPAQKGFEDVGKSAGEAKVNVEDIENAKVDASKLDVPLETINKSLQGTVEAAESASGSISSIADEPIDHTNLDKSISEMNVEFDDWGYRGEYNNNRIMKAVNETTLEGSPIPKELREQKIAMEDTGKAAENLAKNITSIGDTTIDTANIDTGSNQIITDMGAIGEAADHAEEGIKKPGLINPPEISGKVKTASEDIVGYEGAIETGATKADEALNGIGDDTENIDAATTALGFLKDETQQTYVVTDEFTKSKITAMVDALGGSVKELASAWNSETGELTASKKQLDEWFDKAKEIAMYKALQEAMEELYSAWGQAAVDAAKANSAVNEALREFNEEAGTSFTNWQDAINYATSAEAGWIDASMALGEAVDAQKACNQTLSDADAAIKETDESLKGFKDTMDAATGSTEEGTKGAKANADATANVASQTEILIEALGDVKDAEDETAESTEKLTDKQKESLKAFQEMAHLTSSGMVEMMDTMQMTAGEFAEWCQEQVDYIDDLKDSYEKLLESVESALSGYVENLDTAGEEGSQAIDNIISNLQSRNTELEAWVENMKYLGAMAGDGLPQELYDHLLAEGPDKTMEAVQALVDAAKGETGKFEQVADEYNKGLTIKKEAAVLASYSQTGKDYAKALDAGFIGTQDEYEQTVQSLVESGALKAVDTAEDYNKAGETAGKETAEGIDSEQQLIESSSKAVVQAGFKTANTAADVFKTVGQVAMSRLSIGMNLHKDVPINRAQKVVEEAISKAKNKASDFKTAGEEADNKIAFGMKNNRGTVNEQARTIMSNAADAAKTKSSLFRTPGENAGRALGDGIYSQNAYAVQAAASVAANASYAPYSYYSSFYSAGSYIIAGLAQGISANAYQAAYAAASAARSAYSAAASAVAVASPSKKFYEIGKFVDEGFALGISKNQRLIEDAAREAAKSSIDTANNSLKLQSTLDIVGAERLNEMGRVQSETADTAEAIRSLSGGMRALTRFAESLSNPQTPNVTVMIGNKEFKGYIVNTAVEGMGQMNQSLLRGVGA